MKRVEHFLWSTGFWDLGLLSLKKRRLKGVLLMCRNKESRARLFPVAPVTGQEAMDRNWNTGSSIWRVIELCNRLSREVVRSPPLEILRIRVVKVLGKPFKFGLLWAGNLEKAISRVPFNLCSYVILWKIVFQNLDASLPFILMDIWC